MATRKSLFATLLLGCLMAGAVTAAGQVEVPFRQDGRNKLIFLEARINGKPALLLLDSGATITIVNARLLEIGDWDLRASKFSTEGPGFGGKAVWADAVLALAPTQAAKRRVAAVDLELFARSIGRRIDGLLGQDFLAEFDHVVIDFKAKKLLLYQ